MDYDRFVVGDLFVYTPILALDPDPLANNAHNECYTDADAPHCTEELRDCGTDGNDKAAIEVATDAYSTHDIVTHTIGISADIGPTENQFLRDVAAGSGGDSVFLPLAGADSDDVIVDPDEMRYAVPYVMRKVFANLFDQIGFTPNITWQRFAAPAIPPAPSGTRSGDDIYAPLFLTDASGRWKGNLFKCPVALDGDGNVTSTSFACDNTNDVYKTGCATGAGVECMLREAMTDNPQSRNIYSSSLPPQFMVGTLLHWVDGGYPTFSNFASHRDEESGLKRWWHGLDTYDEDFDGHKDVVIPPNIQPELRGHLYQDFVRATPLVLRYDTGDPDNPREYVVAMANSGSIHAFDAATGEEEFTLVMPNKMMELHRLRDGRHQVMSDGHLTLAHRDCDKDGMIDNNTCDGGPEEAYVVVVEGNGETPRLSALLCPSTGCGNCMYVFNFAGNDLPDGTNDGVMKGLMHLQLCPRGLGLTLLQMGRVTSRAVAFEMNKSMHIAFGAGYDPEYDNDSANVRAVVATTPYTGLAFYILNLQKPGAGFDASKLLYAKFDLNSNTEMVYPMVGQIASVNSTGIGNTRDRLYVGDFGGQLWRIDVYNKRARVMFKSALAPAVGSSVQETMAIWERPDVVTQWVGGKEARIVFFGTGNRRRVMDRGLSKNRLYAVVDPFDVGKDAMAPVDESELLDVSTSITSDTAFQVEAATAKLGWYRTLDALGSGEKNMAQPLVLEGTVYYSTFVPQQGVGEQCTPGPGLSYLYALNFRNGAAPNTTIAGATAAPAPTSLGGGIPIPPGIYVDSAGKVHAVFGTSTSSVTPSTTSGDTAKICLSGWSEELIE
jgi:type IV pilus assembly protein PilY1